MIYLSLAYCNNFDLTMGIFIWQGFQLALVTANEMVPHACVLDPVLINSALFIIVFRSG